MQIITVTQGALRPNVGDVAVEPCIYQELNDLDAPKRISLECSVVDWIDTPDAIFLTEHRHDGTALFTYAAISAVCQSVQDYFREHGGTWQCSKVHIHVEHDIKSRWPMLESVYIGVKRE